MKRLLFSVFVFLALSGEPQAMPMFDGEVFVTGGIAPSDISRFNSVTGVVTTVSSGGLFGDPYGMALTADGNIFVADDRARSVIHVNPLTGAQTLISSGGLFDRPLGIAIATNGDLFIADSGDNSGAVNGKVIRVNPTTGVQTIVSASGSLVDPSGIVIGANGDIFVTDYAFNAGPAKLIRIDPSNGTQTIISTGGSLVNPLGLVLTSDGKLLVADRVGVASLPDGRIIQIDPLSGAQAVISSGGNLFDPTALAIAADGTLLVADPGIPVTAGKAGVGGIIAIDALAGTQTRLNPSTGYFLIPRSIVVAPSSIRLVPEASLRFELLVGLLVLGGFRLSRRLQRPDQS